MDIWEVAAIGAFASGDMLKATEYTAIAQAVSPIALPVNIASDENAPRLYATTQKPFARQPSYRYVSLSEYYSVKTEPTKEDAEQWRQNFADLIDTQIADLSLREG